MMKNLFTAVLTLLGFSLYSQINCTISLKYFNDTTVYHGDTILCNGTILSLYTGYSDTLDYYWEPGGETSSLIEIEVDTTKTYYLTVVNDDNTLICSDSVVIQTYPYIFYSGDSIVCYNSVINLITENAPLTYNYIWLPDGVTQPIYSPTIKDTSTIYLEIYKKSDTTLLCADSITIYTYPKMVVEFEQVNKGCPDECKSQVIASASGGFPPYRYLWVSDVAPNDSSLALGLCSDESYILKVLDTVCLFDTSYTVETFTMPQVEVNIEPDTIYIVNPEATLSFENLSADSIPLTNWTWVFSDGTTTNEMMPTHVFSSADTSATRTDTVLFVYTTDDGCTDTVTKVVSIKEFKLDIPNVFTPNDDGVNDRFKIPNLERYPRNDFIVFNRWGKKIFETSNYNSDWDGGNMPDGTYFYILHCYGYYEEDIFRGVITIFGSGH